MYGPRSKFGFDVPDVPNFHSFPKDEAGNYDAETLKMSNIGTATVAGDSISYSQVFPTLTNTTVNTNIINGNGGASTAIATSSSLTLLNTTDAGMIRVGDGTGITGNITMHCLASQPKFMELGFNGYYNVGEIRYNTAKKRYRFICDQRNSSDLFELESYDGTTLTNHMYVSPGTGNYMVFPSGIRFSSDAAQSTLSSYEELDVATVNLSGAFTSTTTAKLTKIGRVIHLNMPSKIVACASGVAIHSDAFIPTSYRPSVIQQRQIYTYDNGSKTCIGSIWINQTAGCFDIYNLIDVSSRAFLANEVGFTSGTDVGYGTIDISWSL